MFGRNSRVNPLETRKQLLIVASELNRAQLAGEIAALTAGIRALRDRAGSIGSLVSSTAMLLADLAALKRGRSAEPVAKPSWAQAIFKGAGLISSLWREFRPPARTRD
jgi:hypothetical protein